MVIMVIVVALALSGCMAPRPEGCPEEFWANHPELWPRPAYFDVGTIYGRAPAHLGDDPLNVALRYPDGPGAEGAARMLLRVGVAAYFNAAVGMSYPLTPEELQDRVNPALDSRDREIMRTLFEELDQYNRVGCPPPRRWR